MQDRLIICLASDWELDPTSKHQVMKRLAQRNDVVWVNYHASRRPRLSKGDAGLILRAICRIRRGIQPITDRMVQVTPICLPGTAGMLGRRINRLLLTWQIKRAMLRLCRPEQPVQIWSFAPDADHLLGCFNEEAVVYYCVDEHTGFNGFDAQAIAAAEKRLIAGSDLVLTTSSELHKAKAPLHPQTHLVRHGVEHAHFAKAVERGLPVPEPLRGIKGPVFGFVGLVQDWINIDLLAEVARQMPEAHFAIVGDCRVDVSQLAALPNVILAGRRPYAELPAWCAAFDVGLIPFRRNRLTENVNPIKLREYCAAGLPVVATGLPEVRRYEPDVLIADDIAAFTAACRQALQKGGAAERKARSERFATEDWSCIVEHIESLVAETLAVPSRGASKSHVSDDRIATPATSPVAATADAIRNCA